MPRRLAVLVAIVVATGGLRPPLARADGDPAAVSFEKDVLPVLKENCFKCHDGAKKRAGLRLDVRSLAVKGGESGKPAIVAGKSAASELVRRLTAADEDQVMPPKKPLPKAQIAAITAWIDAGAKWPDALANEGHKHWAFETPVRPAVPGSKFRVQNPIDNFVRARLEREGFAPAPEADKYALVRRLYLDLIGLPPTPKEVDAFVNDTSPDAYEKLVDKLLASPHYGERWARLWLDAARYADSDGFEKDKPRFVWFYRDWVIRAFNKDLPYDRFITEQLAGDLLPNATQDQVVATGFLRNSMINEEGGIDPEQFRMEAMFDRMDAIGKGMLGLTIQCAQCHSHKFDPLSQKEYYRLFAYLNNAHEANVAVYTPDEQMKRAEIFRQIKEIEADLKHKTPGWATRMALWEAWATRNQPAWEVIRPEVDAFGDQKHSLLDDGSVIASGYAPTKFTTSFTGPTKLTTITAARLELLNDPNLPRNGPGRSLFGLFALSEFRVEVNGKAVKIAKATGDADPPEQPLAAIFDDKSNKKRTTGPVAFAIDGNNDTAWTIDVGPGRSNVPRKAVFVFDKPVTVPAGGKVTFKLVQNHGGWNSDDNQNNNLGRFRFSLTSAADAVADPLPAAVRDIITNVPAAKRTPAQVEAVFNYWRTTVPEWKDANSKIEALWKQHPEGATQLTLQERESERPTHVLKRGDFLKPAERVEPGVPAFLHGPAADLPSTRLGLATWLTDKRSPTTARAFVNRVWQAYFGTGIVASSEDFGTQCDPPSHPELLDWLAVEFMDSGWKIKQLHKLIVTSATYPQSSKVTPELAAKDPYNRLLARGPRFRVEAEIVRDIALAAGGLLDPKVGGPSSHPPIPQFLMNPPASYGPKVWKEDAGPDRYRRSMYVFRFRSVPYPPLQAFDAPTGDFACVRRTRSNTPLQALTAMNEPVFVEAARALGRRALVEGGVDDPARLAFAFRLCVARPPSPAEAKVLAGLLAKEKAKYADPAADPWSVAVAGPQDYRKLPNTATPAELAAWVAVARVLLNLDETMTKE
jgi:hypothetical protein